MRKPTRQEILKDFIKWTKRGGDSAFQFKQAVRKWYSCGYALEELPLVFNVDMPKVVATVDELLAKGEMSAIA